MKQLLLFTLSLLVTVGSATAQKIDYDNSSKWFLGVNVGGAWQTTDVKNQMGSGWGLTLGRSYNYNYGKALYFDIRARYLGGKWYGQDYFTTDLTDYNPADEAGFPLQPYKDAPGSVVVNNFQTEVHRLGLELVLHANGIRERTGWDPYIFGGIGLTWHQTYGDLYFADSIVGIYDYASLGDNINSTTISGLNDGIYETALTGSEQNSFAVGVMPSLGFGLGYQIGKRVTLGVEHKTTFTGLDHFDGFHSAAIRDKQDLYHYTSLYLQFRFRTGNRGGGGSSVNNIDNYNTNTNNLTNCDLPVIRITDPVTGTQLQGGQIYTVRAEINRINGRDKITFLHNGVISNNFTYDPTSGRVESQVLLAEGTNTFEFRAFNSCGNVTQSVSINYQNCTSPFVSLTTPVQNGATVSVPNFVLSAQVLNMPFAQGITVQHNNQQVYSFNYNQNNLQANLMLQPGVNVFTISATNACGTSTQSLTINYQVCQSPVITVQSPSVNNSTVTVANFALESMITNITGRQNAAVSMNGMNLTNFTYTNGRIRTNVTLNAGPNVFVIRATNSCGTVTETVTVNYNNCIPPLINMTSPNANNVTVSNPSFSLTALVANSSAQGITLTQNGQTLGGVNYVNGTLRSNVTLSNGANVFVLSASNTCGTVTETVVVYYNNCIQPALAITSPAANNSTVTQPSFQLNALVSNVNAQGVSVTKNGQAITGTTLVNGLLTANVLLIPGQNVFVVTAVNECGIASETVTVNYSNCTPPVIILNNPSSLNSTSTNANYSFVAQVANANAQGITLTQNGTPVAGATFVNGQVRASLFLNGGPNILLISASNECGSASETIVINYDNCIPPSISLITPSSSNLTVTNSSFEYVAQVSNANAQGITLTQNGQQIGNFTLVNGQLRANLVLVPGANAITVNAVNTCGTVSETIIINYNNCIPPTINVVAPAGNNLTVTNGNLGFLSQVGNVTAGGITLTINGQAVSGTTFVNGQLRGNLTLNTGTNVIVLTAINACGTSTETITINYNNCIPPTLAIVAPSGNNTTVTAANFSLLAQASNVTAQQITVTFNGQTVSGTNFSNDQLSANVTLNEGANMFVVTATNACGTASETFNVTYTSCVPPTLNLVSPSSTNLTVTNANLAVLAQLTNVTAPQITMTQNGQPVSGATFANGQLRGNLTLIGGANVIVITATNACGTVSETITINYNNCVPPTISITAPTSNNSSVTNGNLALLAQVGNVTAQGITVTVNGQPASGLTYLNGQLRGNLSLNGGLNTIVVTATNECGTVTETIIITYNNCIPPAITGVGPVANNANVSSPSLTLSVQVANMSGSQGIVLTQNGSPISNFNFASGTVQAAVTLIQGANLFTITLTNTCGTITESLTVNYKPEDQAEQKITICHYPPGNNGNPQTLEIPLSAWPAHQAHGDILGPCPPTSPGNNGNQGGGNNNSGGGNGNSGNQGGNDNQGDGQPESNGGCLPTVGAVFTPNSITAMVTSSKDLSNVVLKFCDNTTQKFEGLTGYTGTFSGTGSNAGKCISGVWIKSGCNQSSDGPGYGEYVANNSLAPNCCVQDQGSSGCLPTVGATFDVSSMSVMVVSTKDLSNVVLKFCDNTTQKYDGLSGLSGAFTGSGQHAGKCIVGVWIKSGCNQSGDGPGYGEYVPNNNVAAGCCGQDSGGTQGTSGSGGNGNSGNNGNQGGNNNQVGGQSEQMITICHYPPGNRDNPQTIEIPLSAWPAHQGHGDVLGPCPPANPGNNGNPGENGNSGGNNQGGGNGNKAGQGGKPNAGGGNRTPKPAGIEVKPDAKPSNTPKPKETPEKGEGEEKSGDSGRPAIPAAAGKPGAGRGGN
jgi:hypothetical protein